MARTVPDHRSTSMKPADPLGLGVAVVGAAVVTAVCAVASYSHIEHLAQVAGQGELAGWLPLGVDGLVASSTASLLVDRRAGRPTGLSAVLGLALGLTGSLAANLVAVDPTLVSPRAVRLALAGYPPVALALAGHVLLTMVLGPAAKEISKSSRLSGRAGPYKRQADTTGGEAVAAPAASPPGLILSAERGRRAQQPAGRRGESLLQPAEDPPGGPAPFLDPADDERLLDLARIMASEGRVSTRTLAAAARAQVPPIPCSAKRIGEVTRAVNGGVPA